MGVRVEVAAIVAVALLLPLLFGAAFFADLRPFAERGAQWDVLVSVENAQERLDQYLLDARYDGLQALAHHTPEHAVALIGGEAWVIHNNSVIARSPNASSTLDPIILRAVSANETVVLLDNPEGFVLLAGDADPRMARLFRMDDLLREAGDGVTWVEDPVNATGISAPLRVAPGALVMAPANVALAPSGPLVGGLVVLGVLTLAGAAGVLSWRVVGPVRRVEACAHQAAAGDRSCRADEEGVPEAVALARAFNRMTESMQQREEELRARAQRLHEDVEDLEYATNHHVREPLRSIATLSGHLLHDHADALDAEDRRALAACHESALFVERLAGDLGAVVDASTRPLRMESVDVAAAHAAAAQRVDRPGEMPLDVHGREVVRMDRDALITVLAELLDNGLKFNEAPTPRAVTRVTAVEADTVFEVEDNGIGVSLDRREEILKPFRKLYRREDYEGTGVGLAVVHRLVQRHGGTLEIEPGPDGGTRVIFRIPA